jgi:hypothetical protein
MGTSSIGPIEDIMEILQVVNKGGLLNILENIIFII